MLCVWLYPEVHNTMAPSLGITFMFQAERRSKVEQKGMCSLYITFKVFFLNVSLIN